MLIQIEYLKRKAVSITIPLILYQGGIILVINTVMRRKDSQVDLQECVVEKAIEISQAEFSALCNGLLEDKDIKIL